MQQGLLVEFSCKSLLLDSLLRVLLKSAYHECRSGEWLLQHIIWIDIWDTQTGSNAKKIINRWFNVGSYIVTVHGTNMNLGVPQCKNYWKWGHIADVCHIQGAKCVRCNSLHLSEHHCHFAWCCKANDKINSPRLEMKKNKPCPYSFKCLNCKDEY